MGGGGGNGGSSGGLLSLGGFGGASGSGGSVTVSNYAGLQTQGGSADGIFAQSIGGGGGNGGNTGLSGITVGGFGGASGNGGIVTVTNSRTATILTLGTGSDAIFAQSIGGGGGNGGGNSGLISGIVAVGGFGGASGSGGAVVVSNDASLQTQGDNAIGIAAQSIGGGGGNGGSTGLTGIAVGGFGGASGNGGTVTVTNSATATILTSGTGSDGIFAQSVGGGGGNGGATGLGIITVGGNGSGAGDGGQVTINNSGSVMTTGDNAIGLFAQSIGGSGGNGGATFISGVTVGGSGGSSGNGGIVTINNTAEIITSGNYSDAMRAQSVGGGGGSAGGGSDLSSIGLGLLVSVGGSGSGGGNGGQVIVNNSNVLLTSGIQANGIYAQSVGGGGGDGGNAIGTIAVGGNSGQQGNGGAVNVTNEADGTIWTKGAMSNGIFAQSIGGGGGNGGGTYSGSAVGFATFVGGNGAGGGNGGGVTVENYGQIETDGSASQAIFAQSVGGGGGNGTVAGSLNTSQSGTVTVSVGGNGGTGGNGGAVTVNNYASGSIFTNGASSTAIFAQSVGGGGGNGGGSFAGVTGTSGSATVNLGGNGGGGGDGGAVTVANEGVIQINANNSVGIMAQSVGGGGGTAGSALGVAVVPVTIGGQNGVIGAGGNVSVTNTGSITIAGANSIGIFAQSVGGGGGLVLPGGGAGNVILQSGGNGNGGTVTINNSAGSIIVTGDNSTALYSQSVGGGGGAVGLAADPAGQIGAFMFSGTAGGTGTAQANTVNQTGNLIAPGANSIALTAQSSGTNGNGDITVNIMNAGSTPSIIEGGSGQGAGVSILNGANNQINNNGIITTIQGVNGFAIRSATGNNQINNYGLAINNYGLVIGSVDLAAGANSFDNTLKAVFDSGVTVNLGNGNPLTNEGLLSPGGYQKVLTTNLTGYFVQSATGIYGADLDLKNQITDRINVTGTASISGTIAINLVDPASYAGYALPGSHNNTLLSAAGGLTSNGITLQAPTTAVSTYSLFYPNATDIVLNHVIDYSPSGLTINQHSVGTAINQIELAQRSPDFRPIADALFFQPNIARLGSIYDSLSGEGVSAAQQAGFSANDAFLSSIAHRSAYWISNDLDDPSGMTLTGDKDLLFAQKTAPNSMSDATGVSYEAPRNWRVWMNGYGSQASYDGNTTIGSAQANEHGSGFAVGIDRQISSNILAGIASGYDSFGFDVPDRQTYGTVDAWHIAGYGAVRQDHFYATGALSYDSFNINESRQASIPGVSMRSPSGPIQISGFNEFLTGTTQSASLSGDFEMGYKNRINQFEVTPFAGLQFGAMRTDGFTEAGLGGAASELGLSYSERTINSLPSRLGVQVKTKTKLFNGRELTILVRAAWMHEFDNERSIESSFIAAPGFDFVIQGAKPPTDSLRTGIGLNLPLGERSSLYGNLDCDNSGGGHSYSGMGGLRFSF